ncbi:MAG TPA: DUF6338 family protein [Nitrospira sp.]|nr:DUF6338 family protein [Nitrospira sp.]
MEFATTEIVGLLNYLLPGLVATWAFRRLTAYDKPRDLQSIVEAVLFTAAIQPTVLIVEWIANGIGAHLFVLGKWTDQSAFVIAILLGLVIGMASGVAANKDWVHNYLRRLKFTKATSYPSEWYRHFYCEERYLILTLKNNDRILGWPVDFPNSPLSGHFNLNNASWLPVGEEPRPLASAESILIPAAEVMYVEFMKFETETQS